MSSLVWRDATWDDRPELCNWICADPPKKLYDRSIGPHHPQEWVLDVQSEFRSLRPPLGGLDRLLLSRDDDGIVGAVCFGFDQGEQEFHLRGIATAVRARGIGIGKAGLNTALDEIVSWRAELEVLGGVYARIHEQNEPSKSLFASAGFERIDGLTSGQLEIWTLDFPMESGLVEDTAGTHP